MAKIIIHDGARSVDITKALRDALAGVRRTTVHDCGCGNLRDAEGEVANERQLLANLKQELASKKITVQQANAFLREYEVNGRFSASGDFVRGTRDAKRLLETFTNGKAMTKVYYDPDYEEYSVKLYVNGAYQGEGPTHYTNDRADAYGTAKDMAARRANG